MKRSKHLFKYESGCKSYVVINFMYVEFSKGSVKYI